MTVTSALLAFAVVAALMTLVPGVDTALILRSAVTRSRIDALVAALGICSGVFVWGIVAAAGASAVLAASHLAYQLLTYAGAAYLIFLGGQMIYRSLRRKEVAATQVVVATSRWKAFGTGLVTNLLNPKIGVFYIAAIPQFTPADANALLMGIALSTVHVVLTLAWAGVLILGASLAGKWLSTPKAVTWMDRITGTVLVGSGLKVALSRP
ncbi:LysE family translocator [Glutamicibacter sp. NPDC087344]|uniref:LysE family translocator n=1 Tax=Glutamicibacter sp. NPDC087344 TaxID=3363994 RepID=UPI0038023486